MSFPQTTPQRPVPGAFLNTPAVASRFGGGQDPVRRQLFPVSESSQSLTGSTLVGSGSANNLAGAASTSRAGSLGSGTVGAGSQPSNALAPTNLQPVPVLRAENVPPVVKAAKAINAFLQADESFPDLDSYCRRR